MSTEYLNAVMGFTYLSGFITGLAVGVFIGVLLMTRFEITLRRGKPTGEASGAGEPKT